MFKLSRPKSGRSGSGKRFSFYFSNFQVIQVPEGFDKLSVALVSMRTGKTIAKLGKISVSNECCQWTETLTESILVAPNEGTEESPLKFVVSTGTNRGVALGEATININRYLDSSTSVPLSLPLSKCDHGTILQLKIQCQTPISNSREEQTIDLNSGLENDEMEANNNNSIESSLGNNNMEHTNEDELLSREQSYTRSGSSSTHNADSVEGQDPNTTTRTKSINSRAVQTKKHKGASSQALKDEIKSLKESNADLVEQLQTSKESNTELLAMMQELEGIVENQKSHIDQLSSEIMQLEEHFLEEQQCLQDNIHSLEEKLTGINYELEMERSSKNEALLECESKWENLLAEKEEEIASLEEQVTQSVGVREEHEPGSEFPQENEILHSKLEELEKECSELVEENMQLVLKLKEAKKISSKPVNPNDSTATGSLSDQIEQLTNNIESLEAVNKLLERKSSDLERGKEELRLHLTKLEEENMNLSKRASELGTQKRKLTDEKESYHHKLKRSKREVKKLKGEVTRLESEKEAVNVSMKQKLEDMHDRWLETQEECEYLRKVNPKLQVTVSNLNDECSSLHNLNMDLKMQNKELQRYRSILEAQVNDSEKKISKCSSNIQSLEAQFSTMLEVMALKEESIRSELEALVRENNNLKERVADEDKLLNDKYLEKSLEVEDVQKELVHLLDQISELSSGNAQFSSETVVELCSLRTEKAKLEIFIEDLREKLASTEKNLEACRSEAEARVLELNADLTSSRQKHDVVVSDLKKIKVKLQSVKSKKKKYRKVTRDAESKFKVSEHEKQQLEKEISVLKAHQQKASQLQDEIVTFKNSLDEAKFEIKRLHASYELLSGDHEKLVSEKVMLDLKLSGTENAASELEEYKCRKVVLEEKILRLEEDLTAREELAVQDAEVKIELGRVERANHELLRKIKYLEEDREEHLKKMKACNGQSEDEMADYLARIQALENELAKALEARDTYQSQLSRFLSDEQTTSKSSGNAKASDTLVWNLQSELKDLRERYFQMSCQYAEVEAQREELVMKLKTKNNKKGWFS